MNRNITAIGIGIIVALTTVTILHARPSKRYDERTRMCRILDEGRLGWESEPWGMGAKKFQEVCKNCHSRDNDKEAPFLHAKSYVSEGWNRIFAKRRVACARDGSWDSLTEEEIQIVNDFLYRNAAWTYNPYGKESCG